MTGLELTDRVTEQHKDPSRVELSACQQPTLVSKSRVETHILVSHTSQVKSSQAAQAG